MFNIEEELKKLPAKPGVYIMHDANDTIIYVGKAISLKNRVRQYFQSSRNLSPKIQKMVSRIAYFEYIVVTSEMEALVLECNLIKENHPKYNTMLKDDKGYPYIKVTVNEEYPRVMMARTQGRDKARYFGPYTSAGALKEVLELLRKLYHIRSCQKSLPKEIGNGRPCLYYHIKQCKAPCMGYVSKEEYRESIDQVIEFLNGNYALVTKRLEAQMLEASENLDFEKAAEFRDLLSSVKKLAQKQDASNTDTSERDIIAFASTGTEAVAQVFFVREGKVIGRDHFHMTGVESESRTEIMTSFVKQFYAGTPYVPREILLSEPIEDEELIAEWLSAKKGMKVHFKVPKRGSKERLIELAERNASVILQQDSEKLQREEARTVGAMKQIAEWLDMPGLYRVEAFDISNINGFESVGSMVVYEKGRPKRSDYRKFRIRSVQGPDDYASMREVLTRRFEHGMREEAELAEKGMDASLGSFTRYPDLIMMDGGRGQVTVAEQVLAELTMQIPVCGMVKDDNHRTRGLYYNNVEIPIDTGSEGFKLITRIQDETHRFAIEYHRSLRGKAQGKSILDDIEGIGETRRRELMKHYQSLEAIRVADVEDLAAVPSMNRKAAEQVYEFFRRKEEKRS